MTKKYRTLPVAIAALLIASLACTCGFLGSAASTPTPDTGGVDVQPTTDISGDAEPTPTDVPFVIEEETPTSDSGSGDAIGCESEFPLPDDAQNCLEASGTLIFQTNLSLEDTLQFYKEELTAQGLTERPLLTVTSDTTFSTVFDGHPSGKSVVVQSLDLGNGSTNVTIRLEVVQ